MLKIIDSFENLESLTLYITNRSYPNYNNMLVGKAVTKIKELNINFVSETSLGGISIYLVDAAASVIANLIVELFKLTPVLKSLSFTYAYPNFLARKLYALMENNQFYFSSLESFQVKYKERGTGVFLINDLLLLDKLKAKKFTLTSETKITMGDDDIECLKAIPSFLLQELGLALTFVDSELCSLLKVFFSKIPQLAILSPFHASFDFILQFPFRNCNNLQRATIITKIPRDKYDEFFSLFPSQLSTLYLAWYHYDLKGIREVFHKRFPNGWIKFFAPPPPK